MNKPVVQSLDSILRKVGGEAVRRKGFGNEDRVLKAFEVARVQTPVWFRDISHAPHNLDIEEGVDFVVNSDVGKLYLQVKSSKFLRDKFCARQARRMSHGVFHRRAGRRYNEFIAVIVVLENDSPETICQKTFDALGKKRKKLLELRSRTA